MDAEWMLGKEGFEENLLETDISKKSHNKSPWNQDHRTQVGNSWNAEKLVLKTCEKLNRLKISDTKKLSQLDQRFNCPSCQRTRKFYCYSCQCVLDETRDAIPRLSPLPCPVDVIKHPQELDSKSTAIHAKILCPDSVRLFEFPHQIPDYDDSNTMLVFPKKGSIPFKSAVQKLFKDQDLSDKIDLKIVFIDSTWSQSKQMISHPKLNQLPTVVLEDYETLFWRNQKGKSNQHLATIEAIYYACKEFLMVKNDGLYEGQVDDLLFLFKFQLEHLNHTHSFV